MFGNKALKEKVNRISNQMNEHTIKIRDVIGNLLGQSHDGNRSTYSIYGYPVQTQFREFYDISRREGIANRIVFGVPHSCWRDGFEIHANEKEVLEDELQKLNKLGLLKMMERVDSLNRMGRFSVMFIGVPDGLDPSEPIGTIQSSLALDTVYFRAFAYDGVTINRYDNDVESPRYGMPELYTLQVMGRGDNEKTNGVKSLLVHWSRVVHLVENPLDSDVEGIPALEPVYNRILDLDKTIGGAAEAYFRNARGKTAYEVDPEFASSILNDPDAKQAFDDGAAKYTNQWQDFTIAAGAKVKSMSTPHASPMDTVKVAMYEISGNTGIPIRILTGEGGGQLAGSQDKLAYGALIEDRQESVCTSWIESVFDVLSNSGCLELPEDYEIVWPVQAALTETERADINRTNADTIKTLVDAKSVLGGDGLKLMEIYDQMGFENIIDIEPELEEPELPLDGVPPLPEMDSDNGIT